MNKVYKVVWSDAANAWVAVSEISTAHGKSKSSKTIAVAVAAVGMMLSSAAVQAAGLTWGTGAVAADDEAIAMGNNSDAKTNYTIVLGSGAKNKSNGESAVVIGHGAEATSDANPNTAKNTMGQQVVVGEASVANSQSVALGAQVYATGQSSIAIGGDDLGNNDSKTSAGKYSGAQDWRNYAGQPITVEGVSTKDASDPAIGFTSTTASGRGSVAIGHMSQSTGKASLAFGADSHAEADGAIAAGMASQAKGSAAVAIGVGAEASEAHATAIGLKAKANGGNAFAAGSNAEAGKVGATAVGLNSNAAAQHAIAIGSGAKVNATADTTAQNTTGVSDASIAIGQEANSEGLAAVALGAKTKAKEHAVAIGTETKAEGLSAVAIGSNSSATTTNSVAMGTNSAATGANATALGQATKAKGQSAVAIGDGAETTDKGWGTATGNVAKAGYGAAAYGHQAEATGDKSVAVGDTSGATGNNAVAIGNSAKAKGEAIVAIGQNAGLTSDATTNNTNTRAIMIGVNAGKGAQAINDSILMGLNAGENLGAATQASSNNIGLGARALQNANGSTNVALATQAGTGAKGNNNFYGQVNAGSYVTGNNNVAIGKDALKGTDAAPLTVSDAVVLGTSATADKSNAVVLGSGAATPTDAVQISDATVGSTTYGGFAGTVGGTGYQVSVGTKGAERQLKNVAPGEISATSTDAINGSQLFSVTSGLQNQIANISAGGGSHFYHVNGKTTDNNYNNDGATGDQAMAAGINAKAAGDKSIAIGNAEVAQQSTGLSKSEGAVAIGDTSYAAGGHSIALGKGRAEEENAVAIGLNARASQINTTAMGANAVASKAHGIAIGSSANSNEQNAIAIGRDTSATVIGAVALGSGSQATRNAISETAVQATQNATVANNQVYALDNTSQTDRNNIQATVKGTAGAVSVGTQNATRQIINVAAGTEDSDAVNVAQLKSVANLVKNGTPTKVSPAAGSKITVNNKGTATAPDYELDLNDDAKGSLKKADTAMQKFKVASVPTKGGTAGAGEEVADGDTLTFEAGDNVTINQSGKKITINANPAAGAVSKVEAATGSPITVSGDGSAATPYQVGVNTVALGSGAKGVIATPDAADAGKLVTAGEIAKAINNSGFVVTSGQTGSGQVSGTSEEVVNPGETVKFTAGNGIKIDQNNGEFTISSTGGTGGASAPTFSDGQGTVAKVTNNGGVTNVTFDTPLSYVDNAGANTNAPSNKVNLIGATAGSPVVLGNVANGVADNDAVNVSQLKANGFNVAVAHTGTGTSSDSTPSGATGAADKKIVGDETLTFEAGNGINVSQNGGKITITNTGSGAGGSGNTHYYSVQSAQTAAGSNYNNDGATGNNSMAMGPFAKANARNDIAIGHQAGALSGAGPASGANGERVMIGSNATVGSNQAISVNAGGSLGTVNLAVKSVGQSVAIGGGTGAQPENRTYAYGDQSLAIGSDTLAYGDSSVAIGGDDLDSAGAQQISYTDPTNGNQVNGTVRQAYQALTGDTMQNGVYIKTASKQAGVSVGVQAQAGDLGVALGAKSAASGTASTAVGTGASANKDNAIALGAGSKTDTNATQVTSATVGGLTYGNFAGNGSVAVGDQVSVGNTGFERQIKHVAPGEISSGSTDAINGSQLYATQQVLGNVGNTVKTVLGGNAAIDADGNITMTNIGGTGQNTIHDAIQAAKTKVQAADNSPVTVTGTGSSTDPYKVGVNTVTLAPATGTDTGKVAAPATGDAGKLVTAGDIANAINNSGFKATAGGNTTGAAPTEQLIKAGDTLTLKAGNGLTVEQSGSTFTYALNAQQITQNAQTPVVYTQADGSKVYKHTDGNFYTQPNGAGTQVGTGDVIASMNGGDNSTTNPTTLANVKSNLADAASALSNPTNNSRADLAGKGNNAATVNDVLNAGFTVQGNGTASDFVTHGDTVNFVNGQGTVANVKTTNGVTEVKFDTPLSYADAAGNNTGTPSNAVNLVGDTAGSPVTLGNVAAGKKDTDAVNVKQLKDSQTKVVAGTNIASVDHDAATNTYTVNAKGSETSGVDNETVVTATPDATTNVTSYKVGLADKVKDDIKKGVDAKDAVDNKGLTFTADSGDTGVKKLGDSVAIKGDSNIVTSADASGINMRLANVLNIGPNTGGNPVTINGNTGTIGGLTNKTWNPNSITSGQAATEDQLKLVADQAGQKGSFTLTAQGANGSTVGDGSTVDLNNTDGNIVVSKTASDNNVTFNLAKDLKADSLTINNGGPVINGNGINMGDKKITNVADGDVTATSKDAVNGSQLYAVQQEAQKRNTVKAGNNVTVTEAPNANGGTEYTINAEKSVVGGVNDETVVTATNDPNTNTTTYNVGLADKVKDDIKKGADAADAVNNKGLTFKGDSGDTGVKKLGDEVSITGDSNITTKADGNGVQVSLNRDVDVDSVKAGDSTLNNDGLTINGGPSVTKTGIDAADKKVTNVANGDVTATSKDAVNGSQLHQHGDGVKNIIGGNTTYDPNTGSYTNNDIGGTGQSTIDDAIRHINSTANAGWNLQTNGGATEKVGSGETVNFKNGNNISITNTGKEITIATNPDLTADSLTINNGGPVINGNGINMGDKKITNVADGDVTATSKDAVNGSQLYATNQNVANNTANIAKGFNFGDGNTANNYQLGDTISVKGDNNVTSTTVNGGVQLGLNQNLSLTSVTTGNTKMDNNGLTINGGPSVTTNGVDAGGKKITNVAAGEADTDAVNVGQLNQKLGAIAGANTAHVAALEQKINNVEDEADAGTASAMATAGLPQAYLPGKSMIAVGASNYRGKTGYAVGFSAITDGGNWIIKGTASGNSKGRFGASIGAGYQW